MTAAVATATKESDALAFWADFARAHGGVSWHIRDARRQNVVGLPDVLAVLPRRRGGPALIVAIELKIGNDRLKPAQFDALRRFAEAGAVALVVRYGTLRPGEVTQDTAARLIEEALAA